MVTGECLKQLLAIEMSLFQFGFSRRPVNVCSSSSTSVPAHMPTLEESGLGVLEYESSLSNVADHADPENKGRRGPQGSHTHYSAKDKAVIGKYALENGNINAIQKFKERYPDLKDSAVCNYKGFTRDTYKTNESKPIRGLSLKLYPGHKDVLHCC